MENKVIASGMLSGRDNFDAEKDKVLDWRNRFLEESYLAEQGLAAFWGSMLYFSALVGQEKAYVMISFTKMGWSGWACQSAAENAIPGQ